MFVRFFCRLTAGASPLMPAETRNVQRGALSQQEQVQRTTGRESSNATTVGVDGGLLGLQPLKSTRRSSIGQKDKRCNLPFWKLRPHCGPPESLSPCEASGAETYSLETREAARPCIETRGRKTGRSEAQPWVCDLVSLGRVVLEEVISTARAQQRKPEVCVKYHANINIPRPSWGAKFLPSMGNSRYFSLWRKNVCFQEKTLLRGNNVFLIVFDEVTPMLPGCYVQSPQ